MNSVLNAAGTAALHALLGAQHAEAGFQAGQKRAFEEAMGAAAVVGALSQAPAHKIARVDTEFRGKGWQCGKCGNSNHDGRQVCNMRFCQAPRPMQLGEWLCTCGNVNYATRTQCGLRKCQLPRPNDPQIEQIISSVVGQVGTGVMQSFAATPRSTASRGPPVAPEGSWICRACGNINWPTRETCNGRTCGLPRSEVDGGPYNQAIQHQVAAAAVPPQMLQQQPLPEGSWSCLACGNVNWPTRDACNRRTCGRPRAEVDSGQPLSRVVQVVHAAAAQALQAVPPEGSWVCVACRNVNWPTRDTCNRRTCGRPRAEVDGGAPAQGAPPVPWA